MKKEIYIGLIVAIIFAFFWMGIEYHKSRQTSGKADLVAVLKLGDEENIIDLKQNGVYDFISNGIAIHIEVKDYKAAFVHSECKDHICENYGWLEKKGDLAVCLPARAALSIR